MRRKHAFLLLACLCAGLAVPPEGRTQDPGLPPNYWPHRTVGIPVDVDRLADLKNRPTDLQLFYWVGGGAVQKGPKLPLNGMQPLDGGKKGFLFSADRDGDYEFTVQFIYADNSVSPQADQLKPQQRVVLDTTPPRVEIVPGNTGVAWRVTDDNLDPREIKLQCRWPGQREWTTVSERAFQARDQFTWTIPSGKVLEVRVEAHDRAGHVGSSPIVRVPPDAASGVGFPKAGGGGGADWPGASSLPAARIDFVNTLEFDVDYAVQKMGRSGVRAAHLFVQRNQGNWEFVKKFDDIKLMPTDKDPTLSLHYAAKEEGLYGFYVIPESGAGKRAPDPRRDDPAMVHVVVDKTPPYVRITGVQVRPGGARGPVVDITWEAADPNLMPDPVSLEWSLDAKAAKWNEIKYRLKNDPGRNTGRYTWEVPDENLWKFYVRARAVDKAANTGEHVWGEDKQKNTPATEVIVDLENPSGTINRVRNGNTPKGAGDAPGGSSDKPPAGTKAPESGGSGGGLPALPGLPGLPDK